MQKKKVILLVLATCCLALMNSCNYWISAPFTNVEKIAYLKPGMSVSEVNTTLGISPYNIYHIQEDGSSVITYKYRIKNRRMRVPGSKLKQQEVKASEEAQTQGATWYDSEEHTIFVLFKNQKVSSLMSDEGINKSEFILVKDNNIKIISKKEYNNLRKLTENTGTNLLVLNENHQVQRVDLPKDAAGDGSSIWIDNSQTGKVTQPNNTSQTTKKGMPTVLKVGLIVVGGIAAFMMVMAIAD